MTALSSPPPSPLVARSSSESESSSHHPMPLSVSSVANIFVRMRRQRSKDKSHHIASSSGDEPQTHPALQGAVSPEKIHLEQRETFVCRDGVDATKLLRAVRGALYQKAQTYGANVLVDEQWTCMICGPRHRADGTFKVDVHYSASAARSDKRDPQRPVALENARNVPGLMTILSRND